MQKPPSRPWAARSWISLVITAICLGAMLWMLGRLVLWNLPEHIHTASDFPAWLLDGRYEVYGDADMDALRKGRCSHGPIRVTPYKDGSAILTCSFPVDRGPVLSFMVVALDSRGVTGQMRTSQ